MVLCHTNGWGVQDLLTIPGMRLLPNIGSTDGSAMWQYLRDNLSAVGAASAWQWRHLRGFGFLDVSLFPCHGWLMVRTSHSLCAIY